jgi:hypothetical protein
MALLPLRSPWPSTWRKTVLTETTSLPNTSSPLGLRPPHNCSENLVALCMVCYLSMHQKHGSILESQGGLPLIVEHRLPPPAMRRKPLAVQLGLFGNYSRYRQLKLWETCYRRP